MRKFTLLILAGCSENALVEADKLVEDVDSGALPDIEVSPLAIDYGSIESGEPAVTETVTVSNVGDASLEIHNHELEDPNTPYTITEMGTSLIPPGSSTTFAVTYDPSGSGEIFNRVIISSNDPDEAEVPVTLSALGIAPQIELTPEVYDFGNPYIGCVNPLELTVANVGNATLQVSDLRFTTAAITEMTFDLQESVNLALPWAIEPGDSRVVLVTYAPLDVYADDGYLTVSSNDPERPEVQATQTGEGVLYGDNLDVFEQPIRGATDILFVVDNSCSMAEEQANLQSNFSNFADGLALLDADFQIAVITTDNPSFRGEIMTPDTDDLEAEFIAQTSVGIGGSGDEKPTEMAYQATQEDADAGPGSDFLRDDAVLSMIFVSDEPDSSPSDWGTYLDYFQSLKRDEDDYVAHAISGDWPSGCGTAFATNTVYELTVATEGLYLSVCAEDWSSYLAELAEGSTNDLSSFELTQTPVPETIEVRLDGVRSTSGWAYDTENNTVDFDEDNIPAGGTTIEVEYALLGDCDG